MGMEQTVRGSVGVTWAELRDFLGERGYPVQLRMIDGELAFPEEMPPETWSELRIGTPAGMLTLRRGAEAIAVVTWGNADATLRQAWNALVWACAAVGSGVVETTQGMVAAAEFRSRVEMPAALGS